MGNDSWLGYLPKENATKLAKFMDSKIRLISRIDGLLEPNDKYPPNFSFSVWVEKNADIKIIKPEA